MTLNVYANFRYAVWYFCCVSQLSRYAECRDAECRYTECRYAECLYAECPSVTESCVS